MNVGDKISAYVLGAGNALFGISGAREIYYLDKSTNTIVVTYLQTTAQYQFVTFECIATDKVIVTCANGEMLFDGGARQNSLGLNPKLFGTATVTGNLATLGTTAFSYAPVAYNTTSGTTITANDFINGMLTGNPTLAQAITGPTASDINTALVAKFGSFGAGQGVPLKYDNQSAVAITLTAGTNTLFSIGPGGPGAATTTILANDSRDFLIYKNSATPTFLIFG